MTDRLFLDTTVLVHAAGGEHPMRDPCRALLMRARDGIVDLHASVEAVQEFLFHRLRRAPRPGAVAEARDISTFCQLHAFDAEVLDLSIQLVETTGLRGRDAVHTATALHHGFDEIVSADTDFDGIPGLARVDPSLFS